MPWRPRRGSSKSVRCHPRLEEPLLRIETLLVLAALAVTYGCATPSSQQPPQSEPGPPVAATEAGAPAAAPAPSTVLSAAGQPIEGTSATVKPRPPNAPVARTGPPPDLRPPLPHGLRLPEPAEALLRDKTP